MEAISVLFFTVMLLYAGYSDIRRRSVANTVWLVLGVAGVLLAGYRAFAAGPASLLAVLLSIGVIGLLAYMFFRLGYLGGADAKALICLALLFPVQPGFVISGQEFPLLVPAAAVPFPPVLLVLGNGLALALGVPVGLFLYNLYRAGIRGLAGNGTLSFVAYRADIESLGSRRFVKLAHAYEESGGRLSRRFAPGGLSLTGDSLRALRAYRADGRISGGVWVTPQLPFMVFIAIGFIACCLLGV